MAAKAEEKMAPGKAIWQLVVEAQSRATNGHRSEERFPFVRPVSMSIGNGICYSAFTREISASAIGLLHSVELPLAEVEISISSEQGSPVRQRARIAWCKPFGEGWYISAGNFV